MNEDAKTTGDPFPYTVTREKQSRIVVSVTIGEEERQASEKDALAKLASNIRAKGFRPGKAPEHIVREQIKEDVLLEETIHGMMPRILQNVMQRENFKPILHPKIEVKSAHPLSIAIILIEEPKTAVKALNTKAFAKKDHKVDVKDIDRVVDHFLRELKAETIVDRAAKEGDIVIADFFAHDESGKEIEGTRTQGYSIEIGSKTLIPGFEEGVTDMKKGEEKTLTLTFPEKYQAEHLRGKKATFRITAKEIKEVKKPELTAALVKEKTGAEKTPEEFRKEIEKSLIEQEEHLERERRERALFDAIAEATKVDLAPELVDAETRAIFEQLQNSLQQQNATIEDWLKWQQKKAEDMTKEMKGSAVKRLTVRFGLKALMEKEKIAVTPEEIEKKHAELHAHAHPHDTHTHHMHTDQIEWELKVQKLFDAYLG